MAGLGGGGGLGGAVVELAGETVVKGVTVVGAPEGLAVWTSGDGGGWNEAAGGVLKDGVLRVDLSGAPQTAKSVKVGLRPGGEKKTLRLKKVLVYGERLF